MEKPSRKTEIVSSLHCLSRLMEEERGRDRICWENLDRFQAEFSKKAGELVALELAAYRRKYYPKKSPGP